jgi:hypothetical protein
MSVLERQNMRIAELEAALHNGGGCGNGCCDTGCCDSCCDSCCDTCCNACCGCCDPCCRPAGVIGGAEIAFLKPHHSMGINGVGGDTVNDFAFSYEASPRIWAGFQGSDGLGARIRYWEFNHDEGIAVGANTQNLSYDTYIFDIEVVDSMSLGCYWDASVFAGFRYLEFDEEYTTRVTATGAAVTGVQFDNSSYGLTVGGELRRCIGNGLAAYINTRGSVLMGDEDETSLSPATGAWVLVDEELDNIYYIWEAQAGAQATRELQMGGYAFARAGFEVQVWDNVSGEPGFDGGEAWGLGGFAFSAGIIR